MSDIDDLLAEPTASPTKSDSMEPDHMGADTVGPDAAPRNKGGAPKNNRNALRHGLRGNTLPEGCEYIERSIRSLRRCFLTEIKSTHGGNVSPLHEALVQSACRHETRAMMAARWLRTADATLTLKEQLAMTAAISAATDARDKCLMALGIDKHKTSGLIQALYGPTPGSPQAHDVSEPTAEPSTEPIATQRASQATETAQ